MSTIKNFYFDEINSSTNEPDDYDFQYQQYLEKTGDEEALVSEPATDLFAEELPSWMHNLYR